MSIIYSLGHCEVDYINPDRSNKIQSVLMRKNTFTPDEIMKSTDEKNVQKEGDGGRWCAVKVC